MIDFAAAVRRLPRGRAAWVRLARHHLRNLGGLAALLAATTAHAEGSRTLFPATYPAGGFRADLDLTVDATPSTAPYAGVTTRRQFLYVYANAGEYIVLGSSNRNPANGGDILVFNPQSFGTKGAETIPATADFTCSAATPPPGSFSGGSLGYIDTRQHELDGPRSADGTTPPASGAGYSPCAYRAPVTGIYGVRFTVATSGGTGPTGSVGTLHIGNATVAAWDVTVRSSDPKSVTDINGRVFTYAYVAFTGNNSRPVFHTLYYATTDGQRYQQDMQGFDPNGYALWANVSGFLDNGQPLYKDIRGGNAQITPGSGQFIAELSAEQPQMPIFFSSIDPSGPNAATATTVLQALGIPLNPPTPQLSNVAFNGLQSGNQTYLGGGGTFTFTTQNDTTYQIIISAGVDFDPGNPANATLTGLAPDGNNTVTWNGLANNGTTFPTGTFNFQILGRNGEIHFPIIDDEGSQSGGPVLTKLNGSNLGDHTVFYDDRGYVTRNNVGIGTLNGALCGAANPVPPAPDHSLTGQDSSAKTFSGPNCNGGAGTCYYRYWPGNGNSNTDCASTAGFGDAKALDLWSYQQTPTTSSTVIINPQPAAAMVSTLVGVPATAFPGATVNGSFDFQNVGGSSATGVTYSVVIGTPGNCPTGVAFGLLPAGVTFTSYNAVTCAASFSGMPTTLASGARLNFNFSYTAPNSGSVPVTTTINSSNGGSASSTGTTQIIVADVIASVSVPATAAINSVVNGTISFSNSAAATAAADNVTYSASIGTAGSCPTGVSFPSLPPGATASYNTTSCQVTFAGLPVSLSVGQSLTIGFQYTGPGAPGSVSVAAAIGTSTPESTTANNSSSGSTTFSAPNLTLAKAGPATAAQGAAYNYTINLGNSGAVASGTTLTVADQLPAGVVANSVAAGSGVTTVNCGTLPSAAGALLTCTVTLSAALPPGAANGTASFTLNATAANVGSITNFASVDPTGGTSPPTPGAGCTPAASCGSATTTINPAADLAITKTDGVTTVTAGGTTTYTITASNAGPSAVTGATVADTFAAAITSASWSCVGSGGGSCTGSGSGNINDTVNLPVGASVTYTVTATISSAASGTLVNTATVTAPAGVTDPTPGNNSATDSDGANPIADLTVTKTANPAGTYLPGQSLGYTITVRNNGPSDIVGGIVTDSMPTELTGVTWSCVGSGGGTCTGSGSGNINDTVNLPRNATVTYTVSATVQLSATGAITNTVAASPPAGTGCTTPPCTRTASVTNNNGGAQQVSITKSATPSAFAVGQTGTYSLLVSNTGSTSTTGSITVSDPLPSGITTTAPPSGSGWDCSASTATMISCTTSAVLLPGANAPVINVPVTIAPGTASPAVNTATVSGGGDATCPGASHCQSTIATPVNAPQIDVTKTLVGSFVVGQSANYVITATNNGQADTLAGTITDPIPAGLTIGTPPPGCSAVGQNLTCALPAGIVPGGSVSYTIPVTPQPSTSGTNVSNTATANNGGDPTCPGASHCDGTVTNTVTAPQLSLTKSATPTTFVVNQTATYSLTLTNTGTAATTATATIRDTIPGGLAIGTLPPNCSATGQDLTCTVAAPLAVNSPVTFNIPVTPGNALNGQSVTNTAGATGGGDPGCPDGTPIGSLPARCVGSVTTPVDAPQLTLIKSASGAFSVGVAASYTLQVTNTGTVATSGTITITDVIPAALTLGTLPPGCSASGQQVTCTIGSVLAVGAATSFVIPVTPTAAAVPSVTNTATAQGGGDPTCPTTANCSSTVTTPVDTPQLTIQKSASAASFVVNVAASYTLQVTNTGTAPTTATATISDVIPGNLTLGTLPPGCSAAGQTVTCTVAAGLAPGASTSFVIPVTPTAAASGTTLSNTATVQGGGDPTCPGAANCSSTVTTPVDAPQLQIVKSASASAFVVGVPASYTLQVTNIGSAATTATATITDVIPGTLALGTLPPGCGAAGQTVTCTIAAGLATGTAVSFVIPVTPTAAASGTTLTNTATVQGGGDPTCPGAANCSSTVSTPVGAPQLQIVKSASSSNFAVGMPASYTLQVTNIGGAATTATATVTDNVPATLAIGLPPPGCSVTGQMVTCTIASGLAVNASVSFVIPVTPTPAAAGTAVTNTATVSGGGDPTCPGAANCTSTAVTPVNAPALRVVKTASAGSFSVGVPASYTITVSNVGGAATTAPATVSDNIPGNLALGTPPGGCSASGQQLTCTIAAGLAPGASTSFVIPVTPTAAAAGTTVSNTATVQGGGDPTCPNANNANCSSTVDVPVASAATPNLVISKTGPATATAGGTIAYTITVTNNGGGTATNAVLNDPAPPGLTFVSASAPCSGGFPCNLGNLAASQSVSVTAVTFTIAPTVSGNIVNTATVVSDQTAQTSSSAATTVQAPATAAQPVPVDARWMLFTLLSLLAGIGARQVRARR